MGRGRTWIALTGSALALTGGIAFATLGSGDSAESTREPASASAPEGSKDAAGTTVSGRPAVGAGPAPSAVPTPAPPEEAVRMLESVAGQLQQAANSGGEPKRLTKEEVKQIMNSQLEAIGVKR